MDQEAYLWSEMNEDKPEWFHIKHKYKITNYNWIKIQ